MEELANALKVIELSEEELIRCSDRKKQIRLVKQHANKILLSIHPDVNRKMTPKTASANTRLLIDARNKIIEAINKGKVPIGGEQDFDNDMFSDLENMFKKSEIAKAVSDFSQKNPKKEENESKEFRTQIKEKWNKKVEKINKAYFGAKEKIEKVLKDDEDEIEI